jgi:hypothetical protein
MKTIKFPKVFALVAIAAIFATSCSKTNDTSPVFSGVPTPTASGSIVDIGSLDNGVRLMKATFNTQNLSITDSNGEMLADPKQVEITFLVNADGFIPSGQYSAASTESVAPFTFYSAYYTATPLDEAAGTMSGNILLGSISVTKINENDYSFSFQGLLDSGQAITGSCNCSLSYEDSY